MLLWVLGGQQLIAEEYMGEIQCTLVGCLEMIPRDRSAVGEKPEGNLRCWYLSCHTQGSFYFLPIFFNVLQQPRQGFSIHSSPVQCWSYLCTGKCTYRISFQLCFLDIQISCPSSQQETHSSSRWWFQIFF